jgi:hypothetical protein
MIRRRVNIGDSEREASGSRHEHRGEAVGIGARRDQLEQAGIPSRYHPAARSVGVRRHEPAKPGQEEGFKLESIQGIKFSLLKTSNRGVGAQNRVLNNPTLSRITKPAHIPEQEQEITKGCTIHYNKGKHQDRHGTHNRKIGHQTETRQTTTGKERGPAQHAAGATYGSWQN